jgi:DNA-binding winged helix-turn-helix (wHTH) protein
MEAWLRLRFGRFELQVHQRMLLQDGHPVAVGARAFDLLLALAERRDRVVTKGELLELAWPGLVVEENNLQVQVSALRKVLGAQTIATIPGRGYRFTAVLDSGVNGSLDGPASSSICAAAKVDVPAQIFTNLPRELPLLYGREADLQALRALLGEQRLVTIVGAGGIGKSRLAQATAHSLAGRWSDGVWMVELAGLSDPVLLPNAVAQALGRQIAGEGAALDELVASLANHARAARARQLRASAQFSRRAGAGDLARPAKRRDSGDESGTAPLAARAAIPGDAAGRAARIGREWRAPIRRCRVVRKRRRLPRADGEAIGLGIETARIALTSGEVERALF